MRRPGTRHSGFTLLEILIALTLSAVLLGVLTVGMRAVVDEWQDSTDPFDDELDTSLIFLQIEQALLGAAPHSYIDQDTLENYVFFSGTDESVAWVSTVSPQARQQMTAWQLTAEDRDGVFLKSTPAFAGDPTERLDDMTGALILPDFDLTVSYLTLDQVDRPEWLDEWIGSERQVLPMAVRLEFASDDQSSATELIIPILHPVHETIQPVDTE